MGAFLRALHERQPLPAAVAHYEGLAAQAELQRLQGKGLIPQAGCLIAEMPLGDASVFVEYEYTPGRPGVHTLRNGDPGYPDEPAEVVILNVLVNGAMVDADLFADAVLDRWVQDILDSDQGDA
jgi:hypothetical protein